MTKRIVIVGGGAAGLELATRLGRRFGHGQHDILLVDRNRTHMWKPLLHEVATGALDASLEEVGYRAHCFRWGYRFVYGALGGVDTQAATIEIAPLKDESGHDFTMPQTIPYDYLILAYGSVTNDFGTAGVREHCLFLDDRSEADLFRERLLDQCLRVSRMVEADPASHARVHVAIVGGGATGVELAAQLFNAVDGLAYYGLDGFDAGRLAVTLVEAGERILPALPQPMADDVRGELEKLGARVVTGVAVTGVSADGVSLADGRTIAADLTLWAAGVKGAPIAGPLGDLVLTGKGQIVVDPTLQAKGHANIFAIGDCAACVLPGAAKPVPPRAQAAHQMANCAFSNLLRLMEGKSLEAFVYKDHGSLVSLSRYSTLGELTRSRGGSLAVHGRLAKMIYLALYRLHLIAIHGWIKGLALIALGRINAKIRPKLKLH